MDGELVVIMRVMMMMGDGDDDDGDGDDAGAPQHSPTWRGSPGALEKPSRVLFHRRILRCRRIFEEGRSS